MNALARLAVNHLRDCVAALGKLCRQPFGSAMTVLVVGIALALPAGLQVLVRTGQSLAGRFETVRDFSVFMAPGVSLDDARALRGALTAEALVDAVRLIPADEAWATLGREGALGDVVAALESNPLPHTLVVTPAAAAAPEALDALRDRLAARADVDQVRLDTAWLERLAALLDVARRIIGIAALLLVTAVLVIVGNTIRLDIQNQRAEIEVAKLLGATDAFVRRPFLYAGFWYGLAGGLVALGILGTGLVLVAGPLGRVAALYGSPVQLAGVGPGTALAVLGGGLAAGLGGAATAVARQLHAIQPRI